MARITHSAYERCIYRNLRRQRRRLQREDDPANAEKLAKLDWALTTPDGFQMTCEQIIADADVPDEEVEVLFWGAEPRSGFALLDALSRLLDWLEANLPRIMEIIRYIMTLFAVDEGPDIANSPA
jgi:hypothetical protein